MTRVPLIDRDDTSGEVSRTLDHINSVFGTTPTMFRAVANSPAALVSMWTAFGAYGGGALGPAIGEQIAVAVANANSCEYCLAAHTALGRQAGVSREAPAAAQVGESDDPRTEALLRFAIALVERRGQASDQQFEELRQLGWSDEEIVETIGQVALNVFINYVNISLEVPVDFPAVELRPVG